MVGIDVFEVNEAKAKSRIRRMVTQAVTGRGKPDAPPVFPSSQRAIRRATRFPGAMPSIWNVPARHPNFVGRVDDLTAIGGYLAARSRVAVQSVYGLGGVGKTQLANEYAYSRAGDYDLVWWLRAEEQALLADQFARLGARLGIDVDPGAVREAVHEACVRCPAGC